MVLTPHPNKHRATPQPKVPEPNDIIYNRREERGERRKREEEEGGGGGGGGRFMMTIEIQDD